MSEQKQELIRLARESGLPVHEDATLTEVVQLLSAEPVLAAELSEALNQILASTARVDREAS